MAYKAIVTSIKTSPADGLDNLLIGDCMGYKVLVGKDTVDGQLGVFFEAGGQLSEEFAKHNDLIRRKDDEGKPAGGMFEENRRVKAITLRGHRSEGYWCPLSYFQYCLNHTDVDVALWEGYEFDELNGHHICNKYFTPATIRTANAIGKSRAKLIPSFIEHDDTTAFLRSVNTIPDGSIVTISEKMHGTSHRVGIVPEVVPIKRNWFMRFINWILCGPTSKVVYSFLDGTRRTVIGRNSKGGFYGDDEFRTRLTSHLQDKLHKGEIIFGEIVGYTTSGKPIMSPHNTAILKDKEATKKYGAQYVYDYGCEVGEAKFFVYRIANVDRHGDVYKELYPGEIAHRCQQLDLNMVPWLYTMQINGDVSREELKKFVEIAVNGTGREVFKSHVGNHPMEGLVIRVDQPNGNTYWLKHKSFAFGLMSGYLKDSGDYVDSEDVL